MKYTIYILKLITPLDSLYSVYAYYLKYFVPLLILFWIAVVVLQSSFIIGFFQCNRFGATSAIIIKP